MTFKLFWIFYKPNHIIQITIIFLSFQWCWRCFSCLNLLSKISITMLTRNNDNGHLCFISEGKCQHFPVKYDACYKYYVFILYHTKDVFLNSQFNKSISHEGILSFTMCFFIFKIIIWFFHIYSVGFVDDSAWFFKNNHILHSGNKLR